MKKFIEEFKAFALRGNMMDMAVGVIIGGAFSDIVTSLTDNFINPVLNLATGAAAYGLQEVAGFASLYFFHGAFPDHGFRSVLPLKSRQQTGFPGTEEGRAGSSDNQEMPLLLKRDSGRGNPLPALYF